MHYIFSSIDIKFLTSAKESNNFEIYEINIKSDGFKVLPHRHENSFEFFYIISGSILFHIDGKEIILRAGDSYLVKPNHVHGFCAIECDSAKMIAACHNSGLMQVYIAEMANLIRTGTMTKENMLNLTIDCDQKRQHGIHEYTD